MRLPLILAAVLLCSTHALIPTQETVDSAKSDIEDLIRTTRVNAQFPFIGGFVRLSFHDCVGDGHCDGCINKPKEDNAGLEPYIDALESVYQASYAGLMSRADFYALAGLTASEFAAGRAGSSFTGFQQFKVGRADCSTSPDEDDFNEIFPETEFTLAQSSAFLFDQFGFSINQTIAILGAHTLGRARKENSGYEGKWVRGPNTESQLDNKYYQEIVNRPWEQATVADTNETQWQSNRPTFQANTPEDRPGGVMMLNADIALAYDITPDDEGHVNCSICPARPRRNGQECCRKHNDSIIVEEYARNNQHFLEDYTEAFLLMINHNNNVLTDPTTTPSPSTTRTEQPQSTPRPGPPEGSPPVIQDELTKIKNAVPRHD